MHSSLLKFKSFIGQFCSCFRNKTKFILISVFRPLSLASTDVLVIDQKLTSPIEVKIQLTS